MYCQLLAQLVSRWEGVIFALYPVSLLQNMGIVHLISLLIPLSLFVDGVFGSSAGDLYRGKHLGRLYGRQHNVDGEVYAVDAKTLHIRGFTYDGTGPDAFFWTGFTEYSSPQGIIVPNEKGSKGVLGAYKNEDITITLPDGLTLRDIKWFAVWCRAYEVNFGDFYIPPDVDFPQPHVIGSLSGQHGIQSGPIVVVDAQTILVPDFSFDGQTPDVHFWVGKGKPGPEGSRVTDETGGETSLAKSDKKTMVLTLPGDLTIFDIDYFGVWNRMYYVDFGHVKIPQNINVPPSLRMLGVTPQTKLNCEVLYDRLALEVRWAIAGESIVMQLVGRIDDGHYISFGLSGEESRSVMIGGDVVLAWFDRVTGRGNVVDYFIESKSQCSGRSGVCPDSRLKAEANNVRLLSGAVVNDFTMLTFQRPLAAHDELDRTIRTNGSDAVIWAVGPINQRNEASYHSLRNRDDIFIDFGRAPKWNCPAPEADLSPLPTTTPPPTYEPPAKTHLVADERQRPPIPDSRLPPPPPAWRVPPILCHEPDDHVFYAQMGPTGGKRGYSAITGKVGWGIAWYINGLLVPEVYLVRGKTYTFVVEGGDNPDSPAKYHPFYITDDPEGGFLHKSPNDKRSIKVFAGHGGTGTGRLCQWQENGNQAADSFPSYGAYQRSLSLQCDDGHPGILHWTPDVNTPDTVYYQCYTHRYLGWKMHVVDACEGDASFPPSQQLQSRRGEEAPTPPLRRENPKLNESIPYPVNSHHLNPQEPQPPTHYQRVPIQEPYQQPQPQQHHLPRPLPQTQPYHLAPQPPHYVSHTQSSQYSPHPTQHSLQTAQYSPQSAQHSLQQAQYSPHPTQHSLQPAQYAPQTQPSHFGPHPPPPQYSPQSQPSQYSPQSQPSQYSPHSQPSQYSPQNQPSQYSPQNQPSHVAPQPQPPHVAPQPQPSHVAPQTQPPPFAPNPPTNYQRPTPPPPVYSSPSQVPPIPYPPRPFPQTRAPQVSLAQTPTYDAQLPLSSDNVKFVVPPAGSGPTTRPWSPQSRQLPKRHGQEPEGGILRKEEKFGRQIQGGKSDVANQERGQNKLHILTDIWSNINRNREEVIPERNSQAKPKL